MDNYNEKYQLSSTKAIQEISKLKFSLTKKEIEILFKRFEADRWIIERYYIIVCLLNNLFIK